MRTFRDQAIENVDRRYGYTYEFSHSPERHLQEYDEEEARLENDCEGCDFTPCLCHVPQSERWEGR